MIIEHPYQTLTDGHWLRGNLHAHTTRSDGQQLPQAVIDDYAGRGYGFLMISDHDIYTSSQDYAQWNDHGMILIPGNEITQDGPHLLHVNADRRIEPHWLRQQVFNEILTTRGFAVINHPNWFATFDHCSIEQMQEWVGYIGMEIYNGVIGYLDGSSYATNKWDMLLAKGRRLWGFANDDSHHARRDIELGWNTVYITDLTPQGVADALSAGRFYGSTGVEITDIRVTGQRIRIETRNANRIVALQNVGKRFCVVNSNVIEIDYPEDATYVRFECWADGEKFAWTQPFFATSSA